MHHLAEHVASQMLDAYRLRDEAITTEVDDHVAAVFAAERDGGVQLLFEVACMWAGIVARGLGGDGPGTLCCQVEVPDDEADPETLETAAALIAAVGNKDFAGAKALWKYLSAEARSDVALRLLCEAGSYPPA